MWWYAMRLWKTIPLQIESWYGRYSYLCWPIVSGICISIKTLFYRLTNSHCRDKAIRPSHSHSWDSYLARQGFDTETTTKYCRPTYNHYNDVIMCAMASQITSLTLVYSTVYSCADQRKHQSSATGLCEGNSPVTGEFPAQRASYAENMFPFDDVIMAFPDLYLRLAQSGSKSESRY